VQRLGHHLEEREWTLDGVRKRAGDGAPSCKVCKVCFATMPSGAQLCPECGAVQVEPVRELKELKGELEEVHVAAARRRHRTEQARAQTLEDLIAVGQRRGMKNPRGWARHVLAARQTKGQWGRVA
jgi:ribosomal protein L40E